MPKIENNYDPEKSTQIQTPKYYEKYTYIDKGLEAQEQINQKIKQEQNLNKEINELTQKQNELKKEGKDLKEEELRQLNRYKDRLQDVKSELKEQQDIQKNINEVLKNNYNTSIENESKLKAAQKERKEEELYYEKELERIAQKREEIKADKDKSLGQKYKELEDLGKEEESTKRAKQLLGGGLFDLVDNTPLGKIIAPIATTAAGNGPLAGPAEKLLGKLENKVGSKLLPRLEKSGKSLDDVKATTKLIENGIKELRGSMTKSINQAASSIQSYYGKINANLETFDDSGLNYDKISDDVQNNLGFSRLIKQTDYLNQIASLTDQGLVEDIEQRALLQTIKDKTLTSFDVANAGLTRLVRLGEQGSVQQFGLELQLKKLLNSKILGDASYLNSLFDSVTSTIIDAGVAGKGDITNFNSTVQTWLGAMYASGLSDNVVSSIASGINALGSGNVNALASDESTQRLFLLAMDKINMNYADILQQGLSANDTNKLLESIINLLHEISGKTDNNLVLKSSYSNLFNLSVSDLKAIQNVYENMSAIANSRSIVNESEAIAATNYAISTQVAKNTKAFEQFENFFANFNYSFGSNIAENNVGYTAYRIADITYNLADQFSQVGGILGKELGKIKNAAAITQLGIGGLSALGLLTTAVSGNHGGFGNASLSNLLGDVKTYSGAKTSVNYSTSNSSSSESNFKSFWTKEDNVATVNKIQTDVKSWEGEDEDKVLTILQKFEGAIMQLKSSKEKYAVAVSLQGMDDEVLKSFASIFADEDAMLETFTGKNNVFKDALFEYTEDTTSNSKKKKK